MSDKRYLLSKNGTDSCLVTSVSSCVEVDAVLPSSSDFIGLLLKPPKIEPGATQGKSWVIPFVSSVAIDSAKNQRVWWNPDSFTKLVTLDGLSSTSPFFQREITGGYFFSGGIYNSIAPTSAAYDFFYASHILAIELYGVPSQGFSLQGRKKSRPYKLAKSVLYDKVDDNFSDCIYDRNASIPTINELMNKMNCDVYHIARTTKMVLMLHRMLYFAFFVPNWGANE